VLGPVRPGLQPTECGGLPRAAGRQVGWASAWRPGPTEVVAHGAGTGHARGAHSRRGHGAQFARGTAQWRLAGGKVLPVSLRGPQGGRRARRSGVELTRAVVRHGGSGETSEHRRLAAGRVARWSPMAVTCSYSLEEKGNEQGGGQL
jgi:hypothetical protein